MQYVFPLDSATAEFILAPFHDPEHAPSIRLDIEGRSAEGIYRSQLWCYTNLGWSDCVPDKVAFECACLTPFDASHHRTLICSASMPKDVGIQICLLRPGIRPRTGWSDEVLGTGLRQEVLIDINALVGGYGKVLGSERFSGLALRFTARGSGPRVISLSWVGLRNAQVWAAARALRRHWVPSWDTWLLPPAGWTAPKFERDMLFDYEALGSVRQKRKEPGWREHFAILEQRAARCMERNPEDDFGDFLPNHDARYLRQHEQGRVAYHWDALVLGFVGLVNSDTTMIEKALRFLMCMVHTRYWAGSAEERIPSSTWNQRSFLEEMTTTSVAILSDWLAFALTPAGKALIRQALWDRGMSPVRRDLLQFDYMHSMNQGAVFCRAGVLGGLMLECAWPRARNDTDESYRLMKEVLGRYMRADGGVHEGIGYLCQMLTAALWTIIAYGRARGLDWRREARELFGNVEQYVAVMSSLTPGKVIPAGDCRLEWLSGDAIPILAALFPGSAFESVLEPCLVEGWVHELSGTLAKSGGLVGMVYGPDSVKPPQSIAPKRAVLQESGKASFSAQQSGKTVRLWVSANQPAGTHAHRDHGNFALEVDCNPVLIDRGTVQYWLVESHYLYRSYVHNVLTPVAPDGSFPDQDGASEQVALGISQGRTDEQLVMPGGGVWRAWMQAYTRTFRILLPEKVVIEDRGRLNRRGQLAFHLQTPLPFDTIGTSFVLNHEEFTCKIDCPWAKAVSAKVDLIDFSGRPVFHLCALSDVLDEFALTTSIELSFGH